MGASEYTQTMRTFEKILEDGRRSQSISLGYKREKRQEWEEKMFLNEERCNPTELPSSFFALPLPFMNMLSIIWSLTKPTKQVNPASL